MNIIVSTLNAKYIHTCLALRYLKAYAQRDFDVDIVEYTIKDPVMNIVSDLYSRAPDVLGFSCYIWNIEETLEVVRLLKKVRPDLTIVLGGPEVSYDTDDWMRSVPEIDYIVVGEGEATFHHLLQELHGERKMHFVFGLAYRNKDGEVAVNPPRPKLDLNEIPSPHRFAEDRDSLGKRVVYFETSRGCPFSCQFCLSSIEVGVRYFDIERTKADLKYLIDSGAKLIKFVDRTFNIKRDYAMEIFQFLIDNHNGCTFQFEITADIMRPEVLDFLSRNAPPGIFRFEIGVQSTNDLTNELVQRRQNFKKLSRTVTTIKNSGNIDQHLDLIAGLPEEDYDSFRKTFNDVFALRPEELQLGFLKLLRGTGLRRDADKYGYVYMDRAPYEILGNSVLPFSDLVRIKRVEDVLEKYWNAHRMDRTLEYLFRCEFDSPFDFFQAFGDYWEEQGWQRIGHQLEDLFTRLWSFLETRELRHPEIALGLMKLDYFLGHRYKPRKIWWDFELGKSGQAELVRQFVERADEVIAGSGIGGGTPGGRSMDDDAVLQSGASGKNAASLADFAAPGFDERTLHKHAVVELLPFDLIATLEFADPASGDAAVPAGADQNGVAAIAASVHSDASAPADIADVADANTALLVYYPPERTGAPQWYALKL